MSRSELPRQQFHELVSKNIYGPVTSRRLGTTVGINLFPADQKVCNYDCVYCQLGRSEKYEKTNTAWPDRNEIIADLQRYLSMNQSQGLDALVLSGNGEPTLYPFLPEIIQDILPVRDAHIPHAKIIALTNGTMLGNSRVLAALKLLDEVHLKMDPDFERINLPLAGIDEHSILANAKDLPNLVIQACVMSGRVDNTSNQTMVEWQKKIEKLQPRKVYVYTVSRATAIDGLLPATSEVMQSYSQLAMNAGAGEVVVVC